MPNTYTQLLVQYVFAVKSRTSQVTEEIRVPLEKYITGIVTNKNHKLLAIYCMPDHIHILVGLHPNQSVSDLARDIKGHSTKWLNENHFRQNKFSWQEGFGAFSYAKSQLDIVVRYVLNQKEHHRKRTFQEEYLDFLEKFNVEYDERYLFDWWE